MEEAAETLDRKPKPNIAGDRSNVLLLIFLFTLQSIPRGMAMGISLILQKRSTSYADQAEFSFVQYPYSLKILWAPIVDCIYSKKIGRRKTWTVPTQYIIGVLFFFMYININDWLGDEDGTRSPKTHWLSGTFFLTIIFCATLEITFDGWALTMLKKRNIGHAGTCNNTGYVLSQFFGFVLFILLDSKDFSNKFRSVPQDRGFVTYAEFTLYCSIICIASSTLILLFKRDNSLDAIKDNYECRLSLTESYKRLWKMVKIKPIQKLCFILLTYQIGLGPMNWVARLKLMDAGVPSDVFASLTLPSLPIILAFPFIMSHRLTGHRSMHAFVVVYLLKLTIGLGYGAFILLTSYVKDDRNNMFPAWHYWLLLLIYNADAVVDHLMYVTVFAFFSRISDPRFGGMYASLLHAASNIGYRWPISLCLWLVDVLTIRSCVWDANKNVSACNVTLDGYYAETVLFFLIGIVWVFRFKKLIYELEDTDTSAWIVKSRCPSPAPSENGELLRGTTNVETNSV